MSTEQPVDPTQSVQPRPFVSGEANPIVDSILARARWAQRALSPWTQRWLSQPAATTFGRRTLPITFTVGAAQQTLSRVQAQYKSHSSHPVSPEANTLPLVGVLPQSMLPAGSAPIEASGPYSRPFNSLEDFLTAIEANKDRAETSSPPVVESAKPAARRTQGPYSKAFNSLEEFMKAAEAARARDYAPPPPEEMVATPPQPQPQPQPEAPRYVHAFNSFEEFAKAAEESRQQWGYAASPEPKPQPVVLPPGKIRPISRVEELPARGSSTLADVPPVMPTPTPQLEPAPAESFPIPDRAPTTIAPIEAPSSQLDSAAPAALTGMPAMARPAVIPPFSPAKARGGKQTQASGPQPVQRKAGVDAEQPAAVEPPQVTRPASSVTSSNQAASLAPESLVEPTVPFVQQQVTESGSVPATYEAASPESRTTFGPLVESVTTQASIPSQRFTGESIPTAVPTHTPISTAPTAPISASTRPSSQGQQAATSSAPSIQRAVEEAAQDEIESFGAEPTVQRQADDASLLASATAMEEEPLPTTTSESTLARLNMSLAQRKVTQAQPASSTSPTVQRHADETPSLAPAAAMEEESLPTTTSESLPVQRKVAQTQPTPATSPVVQHQADKAPSLAPAAAMEEESLPTTTSESMPVQRKVAQAQSAPAPSPAVQRHADETPLTPPVAAAAVEEESLSPSVSMPAQADMPLVQRKATQTQPALARSPVVQRQADEAPLMAPAATTLEEELLSSSTSESTPVQRKVAQTQPALATLPVVQRQADETPLMAPAAATALEEDILPTTSSESNSAQSVPSVPPVQRKVNQAQPAPATLPVIQRHTDEAQLAVTEEEDLPIATSESTPVRLDTPQVQRKSDQAQAVPATAPVVQYHAEKVQRVAPEEELLSATSEATPVQSAPSAPQVQLSTAVAETNVPSQWPVESTPADEALPSAKMMPPARSDMPLVQRHVADTQPLEEESIQRHMNGPASPIGTAPESGQAAANIGDRILARVAGHEQLPAAKLPDLPLHQPLIQRVSASEVKSALESSKSQFVPGSIQRMPEPVIQRTPAEPSTTAPSSGLIQRVESMPPQAPPPTRPEAPAPMDLDNLARQVYPMIKRMLAVERERRSSR
jgi:hypothetical protein